MNHAVCSGFPAHIVYINQGFRFSQCLFPLFLPKRMKNPCVILKLKVVYTILNKLNVPMS